MFLKWTVSTGVSQITQKSVETVYLQKFCQWVLPKISSNTPGTMVSAPPIIIGGLDLKICQNFVGTKFFQKFVGNKPLGLGEGR